MSGQLFVGSSGELSSLLFLFCVPGNLTSGAITGIYHVWLRGYAPNAAGDSVFVGLDDQPVATLSGFAPRIWSWAKGSAQEIPVTFEITQPGEHVLHLWLREDGLRLDRIILTTNSDYQPTANGPAESQRAN